MTMTTVNGKSGATTPSRMNFSGHEGHCGSGTNLKAGGGTCSENVLSCPSTFLALQVQLVMFGERFRDGQHNFVSFVFAHVCLP